MIAKIAPQKRILAILTATLVAASIPALATSANAESLNGLTFVAINSSQTSVTGCVSTCPTNLVIPATVNGRSVTSISDYAFNEESLATVSIPKSVESIGYGAFDTNNLTAITIPDSVTSIGDFAFSWNSLTSVTIPSSITSIGNDVFKINDLTSVTIPDSVTSIGQNAFYNNQLSSLNLPDSVTSIGSNAFKDNYIRSLDFSDSISSIGDYAFYDNLLTAVTFQGIVPTLGDGIFYRNTDLTRILVGTTCFFKSRVSGIKVRFAPTPSAPRVISSVAGDGQVTLTVAPPSVSGGLILRGYQVSIDNGVTWDAVDDESTDTELIVSELTNGKAYKIKVRGYNYSGAGSPTIATTTLTPVGFASAPTITSLVAGNAKLSIKISPPASNGGTPITGYAYSLDGGITNYTLSTKVTSTPQIIGNLKNGTTYTIVVYAITKRGGGNLSASVSATPRA